MYVLGIDIGTRATRAAVSRLDGTGDEPQLVALGTRAPAVAPALRMTGDRQFVEVDESGPELVRDFFPRVGDDVPLVLGGRPYLPSVLSAELVDLVVGRVEAVEGEPAEAVVVTVPGTWGPHRARLLHKAFARVGVDRVGPDRVALVPAPVAAVEGYPAVEVGETVAVYVLGANCCECALVRRTEVDVFELLACAETAEPVGGADFDDALGEGLPIEPLVDGTVDALLGVLGCGPAPVGVLLVGEAAATPLVRRRIEAVVTAPVRVAAQPADSVALGAARAARRLAVRPDAVAYRPAADAAESHLPPPRPPVVISALEPPRRRGARRL